MNKHEDLDFEISFFENIIKNNPNFVEALIALGDNYTKKGRYEEGLKIDLKLVQLRPDDPVVHYNLACSYSLLKMPDQSLAALKKAIQLGYREFSFMQKDPDLDFIRKDPRFKELILSLK
jgi:tetratricopeptide (TPR) repeat protein